MIRISHGDGAACGLGSVESWNEGGELELGRLLLEVLVSWPAFELASRIVARHLGVTSMQATRPPSSSHTALLAGEARGEL